MPVTEIIYQIVLIVLFISVTVTVIYLIMALHKTSGLLLSLTTDLKEMLLKIRPLVNDTGNVLAELNIVTDNLYKTADKIKLISSDTSALYKQLQWLVSMFQGITKPGVWTAVNAARQVKKGYEYYKNK